MAFELIFAAVLGAVVAGDAGDPRAERHRFDPDRPQIDPRSNAHRSIVPIQYQYRA